MPFVRGGGGGGGGDEDDGDALLGAAIKRCSVCRRELLPWQERCPDDGGEAVAPDQITADHDALLERLLAEDDPEEPDATGTGDAGDDDPDEGTPDAVG